MAGRAFGATPEVVAEAVAASLEGVAGTGVAHCVKHFPGHGFVRADSHLEIPVDTRSLKAILEDDAIPYEWLGTTLTSVMPAHVIYPKVDALPAGFSPRWLGEILREHGACRVITNLGRYQDSKHLHWHVVAGAQLHAAAP